MADDKKPAEAPKPADAPKVADRPAEAKKAPAAEAQDETPSPTQAELDELKQRLARGNNYKNRAQTAG